MLDRRVLKAGCAALAFAASVLAWSTPAEAGATTGTWRNGMRDGPYGPGYYGPDGTFYGNGDGTTRIPPRRHFGRPRGYYGSYRTPLTYRCYWVERRFVDRWGRVAVRQTRVCE
jgi:hypothetical protein